MAKKKITPKPKEAIRMRFKNLANGNQSIYLDCYVDGKRSYEFLKLYLIPPVDAQAKQQNANTLQAANAIKAQRLIELTNGQANINNVGTRGKMLLSDWMEYYSEQSKKTGQSDNYSKIINAVRRLLLGFCGRKVMIKNVDKRFCKAFIDYLTTADRKNGGKLAKATTSGYYRCFSAALALAVQEEIIIANPCKLVDKKDKKSISKTPEHTRGYLSVEDLKTLIADKDITPMIKGAFLFSCFCGLRLSDVQRLTWGDIEAQGLQWRVKLIMKKTAQAIYLPLSAEACRWLPKREGKKDGEAVFEIPKSNDSINRHIKRWGERAGIKQQITFHLARHTFATLALSADVDIYTVSSLLGHTNIRTTQIYAKIVDRKKTEAVNKLANLF